MKTKSSILNLTEFLLGKFGQLQDANHQHENMLEEQDELGRQQQQQQAF